MINRKEAADLLNFAVGRNGQAILKAIYSSADGPTRDVLNAHPDLRIKASELQEARVALLQGEQDFRTLLAKVRVALDTDLESRKTSNENRQEDAEASLLDG